MTRQPLRFGMPFLLDTPDLDAAVELCLELGLDFIELNQNFPACLTARLDPQELQVIAEREGIFFTYHLDDALNFCDFHPLVREAYVQSTLDAIRWAATAGIHLLNLHLPRGNIVTLPEGPHYLFAYNSEHFVAAVREFRDRCTDLLEVMGRTDIRLAVENTQGWEDYEYEAIDELLQSPVFGLTLDVGHDHATGGDDLAWMMTRKNRLIHMHAHDGYGTTNHHALGTGEIPLDDRFTLAGEQNATVVLETKTVAALGQSVAWLRDHGFVGS